MVGLPVIVLQLLLLLLVRAGTMADPNLAIDNASSRLEGSFRYNCTQHSEKDRCPTNPDDPCAWEEGSCVPVQTRYHLDPTAEVQPREPNHQANPLSTSWMKSNQDLPTWMKLKLHREKKSRFHKKKSKGTNLVVEETDRLKSLRQNHTYDDDFKLLEYLNLVSRMEKGRDLLGDIFRRDPPTPRRLGEESESKTIVAFSAPTSLDPSKGKNAMYLKNFHYFLDHGIDCRRHSTAIVTTRNVADAYRLRIMRMNHEQCRGSPYSIDILEREDKCYDMESMRTFLRLTDTSRWDFFIYINCGMVGPEWDRDRFEHWTDVFTSRLSGTVKLVGVSINMSFHPHAQSFVLATDQVGINIIKNSDAVYDCGVRNDQSMNEEQRWKIIDSYEIGMSRQILNRGYKISSLTGALGDSFTISKDDFETIVDRSQENSPEEPLQESAEKNIWDSNTESFLLPYGGDIWDHNGLRSINKGGVPSWSDFVFFKASREIILPEIEDAVRYNNPKLEILEPFENTSLPAYHQHRDICEEAKTNFSEASKLSVIVTGYQHSGTTMLAQLIKSDPGLFGGFECGLLLDKKDLLNNTRIPFYDWLLWDVRNDLWGLTRESRDFVVNDAKCDAEMYARLHQYSPLFHFSPNKHARLVDKAPVYLSHGLVKIMDRTPGVPVIITHRTDEKMSATFKKRGFSDEWIQAKLKLTKNNIEEAISKYPDRIHMADTTLWTVEPNAVMGGVFRFLGLEWRPEYLQMDALNVKRVPGSIVSAAHNATMSDRQLQVLSPAMTSSPTIAPPVAEPTSSPSLSPTLLSRYSPSEITGVEVQFQGVYVFSGVSQENSGQADALLGQEIADLTESVGCPDGASDTVSVTSCSVDVTSVQLSSNGNRRLQSSNGLQVEYTMFLCGTVGCNGGSFESIPPPSSQSGGCATNPSNECSAENVQAIANTLYNSVTERVQEATQDGSLVNSLIAGSPEISALLNQSTVTGDFGGAITPPDIALLVDGYPDLWRPDFSADEPACRNDGDSILGLGTSQTIEISGHQFGSAEECCESYFVWDIRNCRKNSLPRKYYPVFAEEVAGCRADGLHPGYMEIRSNEYLFDTLEHCCQDFFPWKESCFVPEPINCSDRFSYLDMYDEEWRTRNEAGYYPDFNLLLCRKNGDEPGYMYVQEAGWKLQTLSDCCWQNFQWEYHLCMGDSSNGTQAQVVVDPCPDPLPQRSGKWYVRYYAVEDLRVEDGDGSVTDGQYKCVKDCIGPRPCDDRATSYEELYDTFHICCAEHLWWLQECSSYDANGFLIKEEPCSDEYWDTEANELASRLSTIYYADFESGNCIRDDDVEPFYKQTSPHVWKFNSLAKCCHHHYSWRFLDCMSYEQDNALEPCSPPPEHTLKYYVTYNNDGSPPECVQDCANGPGCRGYPVYHEELHDSYMECCTQNLWWVPGSGCMLD